MPNLRLKAPASVVADYLRLFVNRRAYTLQSNRPHPESARYYYYRPKDKKTGQGLSLTLETIRRHLPQPGEQITLQGILRGRLERFPGIFKIDPSHRHGTALKGDGRTDHLHAIHGGLIDQHDDPRRRLLPQHQSQHGLGQTGGIEVRALQEAGKPFIAALELDALGQDASHGGEVQPPVPEADAEGQPQEGTSQAREIFAHGATQPAEVGLDEPGDGEEKVGFFPIHSYK